MNALGQKMATFLVAACTTATLSMSGDADAKWTRISAMSCLPAGGVTPSPVGLSNYGFGGVDVYCTLPDDSTFPKQEIAELNVEGYDGTSNGYFVAHVCVTSWYQWSGACGPTTTSGLSYTGHVTLRPSRSVLSSSHTYDFGFLEMHLPNGGSENQRHLLGRLRRMECQR